MILKRRVSLNDVQLDELDDRIIITGIDEAAGKDNITAVSTGYGYGQRIVKTRRETLDVTVKFAMAIKNDQMNQRERLLEKINAWAADGGVLKLGKKTGRRLNVVLAQAPGPGDMCSWSNEFTMVFRAYGLPYWEDSSETKVASGKNNKDEAKKSGTITLEVPGNTETVVDIDVRNWSGSTMKWIHLNVDGKEIDFDGLSMGGSSTLKITHAQTGGRYYFRAMIGSTSALPYRTGANDFVVKPGVRTITFDCQRAVVVTAHVRGRYL